MGQHQLQQKEMNNAPLLSAGLETRLLASQLVSEVRKSPGHYSFTLTDLGVVEFARAMQMAALEDLTTRRNDKTSLFPETSSSLLTRREVITGFGISHTTLWKWKQSGYLTPVKVGKRAYYRREDIERLTR